MKSANVTWTIGWRAGTARLTTLPLSLGVGYVLLGQGLPPINVFVSGEWMASRQDAPIAPQTTVQFGANIAFPELKLWQGF